MNNLKLHSQGRNQFLIELKESYIKNKKEILSNIELSKTEKDNLLKKLEVDFKKEKKKSKFNLF